MSDKSSTLEQRVLEMRFENAQFKSATRDTISAIDALDKSLRGTEKSVVGIDSLANTIGKLDGRRLTDLAANVDNIAQHFTLFGRTTDRIVDRFTSKIVGMAETGIANLKHLYDTYLGFDPGLGGFHEYENMMQSIQTIKTNTASKGTGLDEINAALDDLNTYADQTIYNFQEMTRNIGTFTAAGVELGDAVDAIKGISNLAAGVGSTPQQAATAMYQLSQALASGTVNLQDWNSVVNAGMGGEYFQNALKETAREIAEARGTVVKEFDGTFRESLSAKNGASPWLTSEVLLETLKKFANDPSLLEAATRVKSWSGLIDTMKESVGSGWTQTWQYILGDLDEAADLFTNLSIAFDSVITPIHKSRNEMLRLWKELGGRDAAIKALWNVLEALERVLTPINAAFRDLFPKMGGKRLMGLTEQFLNFTEKLKISDETMEMLYDVFYAFFSLVKLVLTGFKTAGRVSLPLLTVAFQLLGLAIKVVYNILSVLAGAITGVTSPMKKLNFSFDTFKGTLSLVERAGSKILDFFKMLGAYIIAAGQKVVGFASNTSFGVILEKIGSIVTAFGGMSLLLLFEGVPAILSAVRDGIVLLATSVNDYLGITKKARKVLGLFIPALRDNSGALEDAEKPTHIIFQNLRSLHDLLRERVPWHLGDDLEEGLKNAEGVVDRRTSKIRGFLDAVKAIATGLWAGIKIVAINALEYMGPVFSGLWTGLKKVWDVLKSMDAQQWTVLVSSIATFLTAKEIHTAFKSFGKFFEFVQDIGKSADKVVKSFGKLVDGVKDSLKSFQNEVNASAIWTIAKAVALLAATIFLMSFVKYEYAIQAMVPLSAMLLEFAVILGIINKIAGKDDLKFDGKPFLYMAVSLLLVVHALKSLVKLNSPTLWEGILAITVLLGGLTAAMYILGKDTDDSKIDLSLKKLLGIIVFAMAIKSLGKVVKSLGKLEPLQLLQGVLGFIAILSALGVFFTKATLIGTMSAGAGFGILLMAVAIRLTAGVFKQLNDIGVWSAIKTVFALSLVLSMLVKAFQMLAWIPFPQLIGTSAALVITSVGLIALAGAVALISAIGIANFAKAAIFMGILLGAITAWSIFTPAWFSLQAGGMLVFALAMISISGALLLLGAVKWSSLFKMVAALGLLAVALGALGPLLGVLGVCVGLFTAFAGTIAAFVGALAILALASPLLYILAAQADALRDSVAKIITAIIQAIVLSAEPLAEAIVVLIIDAIHGVAKYLPDIMDAIGDLLGSLGDWFVNTALSTVANWWDLIILEIGNGLYDALIWIARKVPVIGEKWAKSLEKDKLIRANELLDKIDAREMNIEARAKQRELEYATKKADFLGSSTFLGNLPSDEVLSGAIADKFTTAEGAIEANSSALTGISKDAIIDSIKETYPDADGLIEGIFENQDIEGIKNAITGDGEDIGKNVVSGFANAISDSMPEVEGASGEVGDVALRTLMEVLNVNSPSKETYDIGMDTVRGFTIAITDGKELVYSAGVELAESFTNGFQNAIAISSEYFADSLTFEPTIRPVIDLSNVNDSLSYIQNGFSGSAFSFGQLRFTADPTIAIQTANDVATHESDNSDVVAEIQTLRDAVVWMGEQIQGMQLVTDTGVLAGVITNQIDSNIGTKMARATRSGRW